MNNNWDKSWYWSENHDGRLWQKGVVKCPAWPDHIPIDGPKNEKIKCPYKLEHTVMSQKD